MEINTEAKNMNVDVFNEMIYEFIQWLEGTDHKSFTHMTSYDDDRHAFEWDVTIKFERKDN